MEKGLFALIGVSVSFDSESLKLDHPDMNYKDISSNETKSGQKKVSWAANLEEVFYFDSLQSEVTHLTSLIKRLKCQIRSLKDKRLRNSLAVSRSDRSRTLRQKFVNDAEEFFAHYELNFTDEKWDELFGVCDEQAQQAGLADRISLMSLQDIAENISLETN